MLQVSHVGRIVENRLAAGAVALVVLVTAVAFAATGGQDEVERLAGEGARAEATAEPDHTEEGPAAETEGEPTPGSAVLGAAPQEAEAQGEDQPAATPCVPRPVDEVGVTNTTITIGQVVTDSNQIPQQLRPAHEGLDAFVRQLNAAGGVCGRQVRLEYRNDGMNPAIHAQDMRALANRVLAFVGNESLLDQLDYNQRPPFEPHIRGGGSFVPDVGGLAFSYGRSQSAWHAGVIGSVSPVLVGGGQYRFYMQDARARGTPCRRGGVVYLQEPTGASEDQARLGRVSLEEDWGGGLGRGNVNMYSTSLLDSVPAYEALVNRMVSDGVNCVFTYSDLQSSINLARAMNNRGVWPPDRCQRGEQCFRVVHVPLSAYDSKFITDGGQGARGVSTFIPHLPLTETDNPAMRSYLRALEAVPGAHPSTFSLIGYASGAMFVEALRPCADAPTRACLMESLRRMQDFTGGGLLGGTTPFRTTRVEFEGYGTFDWKWIFSTTIAMRVMERNGRADFYRVNPSEGFFRDEIRAARGTPR